MKSRGQIRFIISVFFLHCHYSGISVSYFDELKIIGIDNLGLSDNEQSQPPVVFLVKGVLKICSKCTGEHPCRSVISIKLQSGFIEITLWHGYFPVNLLHVLRTPFSKNTSGWLLLNEINQLLLNGHSN